MPDTVAISARPPQAAIAWTANGRLFIEYPMTAGGPPYIIAMAATTENLIKALNILVENPAPTPRQPTAVSHPAIQRKETVKTTPDQRAAAAEVVRRLFK